MSKCIVSYNSIEDYIPDRMYIQFIDHIRCNPYTIQFIKDFYPQPSTLERRNCIRNMFIVISKYLRLYPNSVKVTAHDDAFRSLTNMYTTNTNFGELFGINGDVWRNAYVDSTTIHPSCNECILFIFHTYNLREDSRTRHGMTMDQYFMNQKQHYKEVHIVSYSDKETSGITMPLHGYVYNDGKVFS